jgi:hypothetical protein
MRVLVVAALLVPAVCLALGADNEMYVAMSSNGNITKMEYISDSEPWSDEGAVYGSASNAMFRYCWPVRIGSTLEHGHFVCASKRGAKATLIYKTANYNRQPERPAGIRFNEAMRSYRKLGYNMNQLLDYYICDKGCDKKLPQFVFEVADDEGGETGEEEEAQQQSSESE